MTYEERIAQEAAKLQGTTNSPLSKEQLDAYYGLSTKPEATQEAPKGEWSKFAKRAALSFPALLAKTGAAASRVALGPESQVTQKLTKAAEYTTPPELQQSPEFAEQHPIQAGLQTIGESAAPLLVAGAASRIPGVGPAIAKSVLPSFAGARMYSGLEKQDIEHPERSETEKVLRSAPAAATEYALFSAMPKVQGKMFEKMGLETPKTLVKGFDILKQGTTPSLVKEIGKKAAFDTAYLTGVSKAIGGVETLAGVQTPEEYAQGFTKEALTHEALINLGMGAGFGAMHALGAQKQAASLHTFATNENPAIRQKGYEAIERLLEQKGYKEEAKNFKMNMAEFEVQRAQAEATGQTWSVGSEADLTAKDFIAQNLKLASKERVTNDTDEASILDSEGSTISHDTTNREGVSSAFGRWQESQQAKLVQEAGQEAIGTGGDVQGYEGQGEASLKRKDIIPFLTESKYIVDSYLNETPLMYADEISRLSPRARESIDHLIKRKYVTEEDGDIYPTASMYQQHAGKAAAQEKTQIRAQEKAAKAELKAAKQAEKKQAQEAKKAEQATAQEGKQKGKVSKPAPAPQTPATAKLLDKAINSFVDGIVSGKVKQTDATKKFYKQHKETIDAKLAERNYVKSTPKVEVEEPVKPTKAPEQIKKIEEALSSKLDAVGKRLDTLTTSEAPESIKLSVEKFGKKWGVYLGEGESRILLRLETSQKKANEYVASNTPKAEVPKSAEPTKTEEPVVEETKPIKVEPTVTKTLSAKDFTKETLKGDKAEFIPKLVKHIESIEDKDAQIAFRDAVFSELEKPTSNKRKAKEILQAIREVRGEAKPKKGKAKTPADKLHRDVTKFKELMEEYARTERGFADSNIDLQEIYRTVESIETAAKEGEISYDEANSLLNKNPFFKKMKEADVRERVSENKGESEAEEPVDTQELIQKQERLLKIMKANKAPRDAIRNAEERLEALKRGFTEFKATNIGKDNKELSTLFRKSNPKLAEEYNRFTAGDNKVVASSSVLSEVRKLVSYISEDFGIPNKFFIFSKSDFESSSGLVLKQGFRDIALKGDKIVGGITKDSNNNYLIYLNDKKITDTQDLVDTVLHEVGHAIIYEHYNKATSETKDAIKQAYRNWTKKEGTKEFLKEYYTRDQSKKYKSYREWIEAHLDYYDKNNNLTDAIFDEYLAQQITKYVLERQTKPHGIVEKLFKTIADNLVKFYRKVMGYNIKHHKAVPPIEKWLDGILESQRVTRRLQEEALSPKELARMDELSRKMALSDSPTEFYFSPEGLELKALRDRETVAWKEMALPGPKEKPFNLLIDASGEYIDKVGDNKTLLTSDGLDEPHSNIPSTHFGRGNNIHIRGDVRTTTDGKKVLHINELQSDWVKQFTQSVKDKLKPEELKKLKDYIQEHKAEYKSAKHTVERLEDNYHMALDRGASPTEIQQHKNKLKEYNNKKEAFFLKYQEVKHKLVSQTKEIAPPPIEEHYWMEHGIRQIIRYAQEKGYDTITFPSTPEQVASVENWGKLQYKYPEGLIVDKPIRGRDNYTIISDRAGDVTSIINRMINKVPKHLEELAKEFGGEVKQVKIKVPAELIDKTASGYAQLKLNALTISPKMAKEAERFGPKFSRIGVKAEYADAIEKDPYLEKALTRTGILKVPRTLKEKLSAFADEYIKHFRQRVVDQFDAIKKLDQNAYMLLRLSKESSGHTEALINGAGDLIVNEAGVYDFVMREGQEAFINTLAKTEGEQNRFFAWGAARRAKELAKSHNEYLFSKDDIDSMLKLNEGTLASGKSRALVYDEVFKEYNRIHKQVLDIAVKSGILDAEGMKSWDIVNYVPFFRDMGDGSIDINLRRSGVTNLEPIKRMKEGVTRPLNQDLMANVILNWMHLLTTASKNRAAVAAIKAAEKQGLVHRVGKDVKGAVFYREGGKKKYVIIKDPYVMESLTALSFTGLGGPAIKALEKMKHYITTGVTLDPAFKVRNFLRDSVSSLALSELKARDIAKNIVTGGKIMGAREKSQDYLSLLASGGIMRFGSMLEGQSSEYIQKVIDIKAGNVKILSRGDLVREYLSTTFHKYQQLSDMSEGVYRAALYKNLVKEKMAAGMSKAEAHAEAAFAARDLLDFSMGGTLGAIRFLTTTSPFLNARIQGMDRLIRAYKTNPQKFSAVLAGTALASIALMLYYKDDPDWQKRDDWDRDNYWWFKLPGEKVAIKVPKPFEVGALATMAERMFERMFVNEMDNKRLMQSIQRIFAQSFAIDPIPHAFRPLYNVARNKDAFTNKPIESMSMEKLPVSERYSDRTSEIAKLIGMFSTDTIGVSPVKVDHLINGYFGWLGAAITGTADVLYRSMVQPIVSPDAPPRPAYRIKEIPFMGIGKSAGSLMEQLPSGGSRYITQFYEQMRELERAYAVYQNYKTTGDTKALQEYQKEHKDELRKYKQMSRIKRRLTDLNNEIKKIRNHPTMGSIEKKQKIEEIREQEHQLTKHLKDL